MKKEISKELTKLGIETVVAYGTGYLIGNIIGAFVPPAAKLPVKVCCVVTGCVIGDIIMTKEADYIDKTVDSVWDACEELKSTIKTAKENNKSSEEEP